MGLGKWENFRPIDQIEWVNEIKIFGLIYNNQKNQKNYKFWKDILKKIQTLADSYYLKEATIFGRTTIINTLFEPKFLYAAHIFDPPKK